MRRFWDVDASGELGLARTIVAVRAAVVVSIGLLLLIGPSWVRQHVTATVVVLAAAMAYAMTLLLYPAPEVRRTRYVWLVGLADSIFALSLIGLTGGVHSPVAGVLVLVVIGAAARLSMIETLVLSVLLSVCYVAGSLAIPSPAGAGQLEPWLQAGWTALYLVFVAIMTAALSALAEREQRSRLTALVEAEAEHAAAEEERDLRARLLRSYQSQQDGLQVLVHEFRTPIASLEALMEAVTGNHMAEDDRTTSLVLASKHVQHLADMIDSLSDVALSRRPTFSSGRVQRVNVSEVVIAAADAVGLAQPRLRVTAGPGTADVPMNAQGLRRVLTNLLENAARHSHNAPVDVDCWRDGEDLVIAVADRGPGIPSAALGELTAKYVSAGGQRGTAGLGLWIVQQIVEGMGGRVDFTARDGGGLVAAFRGPVS